MAARWLKRTGIAVALLLMLLVAGVGTLHYLLTARVEGDYFE